MFRSYLQASPVSSPPEQASAESGASPVEGEPAMDLQVHSEARPHIPECQELASWGTGSVYALPAQG